MRSLIDLLRRRWKIALPVGIAGLALVGWLAFGYFAIQTLFIDDKVNEAGPVFESGAVAETGAGDAPAADASPPPVESAGDAPTAPTTEAPVVPQVVTVFSGDFIDRDHPTEGTAVILNDGTEQRFLRFEDFATDNGPDLNVYLSTAPPDASHGDLVAGDNYIDLGDLKGNIGPQNYEIPADVDLGEFRTVVIWCVRFGVAFGAAELAAV